jgi:serine protease Do
MFATAALSAAAGYGGAKLAHNNTGTQPVTFARLTDDERSQIIAQVKAELSAGVISDALNAPSNSGLASGSVSNASIVPLNAAAARTPLTIPQVVEAVSDTVVEIATEQVTNAGYFGSRVESGAGSGVIISTDGYIITNNHVVSSARSVSVRLRNGETYDAEIVGRDTISDLAVLKIEASDLKAASYGNSDKLVVGETVIAIGNPLGQLGGTVTDGIISALNRDVTLSDGTVMNLMQTSAAISPGNSGGGLFNTYGELIGIVNAKSGGSNVEGIGFAIPSVQVVTIAEQLTNFGYVQGRVDFGIQLVDVHDIFTAMRYSLSSLGVYVSQDDTDSGLRAGDRIISIEGVDVSSAVEVKAVYSDKKYKIGDTLKLVISRSGRTYEAEVVLKQAQY